MNLDRMKKLAGIQLHESVNTENIDPFREIQPTTTEYKIGDEIIIGAKWHDIVAINDGQYWIADQHGEEFEFEPGSEDSHTPVQEEKIQEAGGSGKFEDVISVLADVIYESPHKDALAQAIEDFASKYSNSHKKLVNNSGATGRLFNAMIEASDARPGDDEERF